MVATATAPSEQLDQAESELRLDAYPPSPRKCLFYLAHVASLETISETPSTARGEAMALQREWELLRDRRGLCLCREAIDWGSNLPTPGSSGYHGPARQWASDLLADLSRASEQLPACWAVSARIARTLGVEAYGRWQFRFSVAHGTAGDYSQAPALDDRPSLWDAGRAMAEVLGWQRSGGAQ